MRTLKKLIPPLLVLAACAVVLATLFTSHEDDFGSVQLPAGGTVELPEGTVKLYYDDARSEQDPQVAARVNVEITPAGGGSPLAVEPIGNNGNSETQVEQSQSLSELGSISKVDVPDAGSYVVAGTTTGTPGSLLAFGTDPFTAVARRWKLLSILLGAALLIHLAPLPGRGRWDDEPESGWSSDPRAPYATNR